MSLKYKKMILFITMWIMGIGMLTISFQKPEEAKSVPANASVASKATASPTQGITAIATNTPTPIPTATPIPEDPTKLKKCDNPKINQLIETFYQAMLDCDEETLTSIITDTSVIDIEKIAKTHEYIEAYDNFVCYTKPGVKEGDYVVYLTYDIKITTIETYSPSLDRCYVTKEGDSYLIVYNNFDHIIDKLMKDYDESDDIKELLAQVKENLKKAQESDSDLNDFINNLTSYIEKSNSSKKSSESEQKESKESKKQD